MTTPARRARSSPPSSTSSRTFAHDIEDLEENAWDLGEAIDQVSDDLAEIEELVYDEDFDDDEDEDEDEDEDYEPCSCCCGGEDEDEPAFYEVTCPKCGNTITIDEDVLDLGAIDCPNCGEELEFDGIEEDEDEDEPSDGE